MTDHVIGEVRLSMTPANWPETAAQQGERARVLTLEHALYLAICWRRRRLFALSGWAWNRSHPRRVRTRGAPGWRRIR
jgi:hypothetical protein